MTLEEIYKSGAVSVLHTRGLISNDVFLQFRYYDTYKQFRNMGNTYKEAITRTAIAWNTSDSTVKRAVRKLN